MEAKTSKTAAVFICICAYVAAALIGIVFTRYIWWGSRHTIVLIGIADLAATIVVFIFSMLFNNSSFYDPYWSVAPIFFVFYYFLFTSPASVFLVRKVIIVLLVTLWGIRLTVNFLTHWQGLTHEDWRYENFRKSAKKGYWPVSFLGIHFFPTVIVFTASLSLFPSFAVPVKGFGVIDIAAVVITAGAILIEALADGQLRSFTINNENEKAVFGGGLWRVSRHPNYFGEITFWWGIYLFGLGANKAYWWTIFGPLLITLMFRFISLPMIEKRMIERRPAYRERQESVSAIIPWPFKKE